MRFEDDLEAAAWLESLEGTDESFDWDAGNRTKNRKHGVEAEESSTHQLSPDAANRKGSL